MSFSGPQSTRSSGLPARQAKSPSVPRDRPRGSPVDTSTDWDRVALFAGGLIVGALLGGSAALLTAPRSGRDTRARLRRKSQMAALRGHDAWDDLAETLRRARRKLQRRRAEARRRHEVRVNAELDAELSGAS
ncbi:MAG: hypothetical protein JWO05_420 [Gemmatimonadetes bacterium]|nr:hypothetical protein [Gemmatimonadota bacterium]